MDTYTFVSDDKIFQCTVKRDFLKQVPNPENFELEKLMSDHNLQSFLHNPHGPAFRILRNGFEEYWIDGKLCSDEVAKNMKHNIEFHDKFEKMLDEPDKE